jgi:hypothetical protein
MEPIATLANRIRFRLSAPQDGASIISVNGVPGPFEQRRSAFAGPHLRHSFPHDVFFVEGIPQMIPVLLEYSKQTFNLESQFLRFDCEPTISASQLKLTASEPMHSKTFTLTKSDASR